LLDEDEGSSRSSKPATPREPERTADDAARSVADPGMAAFAVNCGPSPGPRGHVALGHKVDVLGVVHLVGLQAELKDEDEAAATG